MTGGALCQASESKQMWRSSRWAVGWICGWTIANASPAMAANAPTAFPMGFIGEAAIVALAFALPAILAGAYLLAKRIGTVLGPRLAIGLVAACITAGSVFAVLGTDLPSAGHLLRLAGL